MSVNTITQKAEVGTPHQSRLQLVYAAHQQLEDALDTLRAYVAAAKKHHGKSDGEDGGFSPWTGVSDSTATCIDAATRCLRLFTPVRTVAHLKGMTTLTALYGSPAAAASPQERVRAFLAAVTASFGGALPSEVALSGGRCLHRVDPAAADDYLTEYMTEALASAPTPTSQGAEETEETQREEAFRQRYRACLGLDHSSATFRVHLRALLLLQMEAAAQADHTAHTLATLGETQKLEEALSVPAYEELTKYERVCWREAARLREARRSVLTSPTSSAESAASATSSAAGAAATSSPSTVVPASTSTHGSRQTAVQAGMRSGGGSSGAAAGLSGWKWQAVRIALLILLAVAVRFASGPLARALKGVLQVTHTAQTRRRTLTL